MNFSIWTLRIFYRTHQTPDQGPPCFSLWRTLRTGLLGALYFDILDLWIFLSGPSGFSTGPIGPWTRVHLVSPYGGPSGLDFWVLFILIFWILEFFYLDPQDFIPDPSDPGPGSTLFLLMEDPPDWTFGCSIFWYFGSLYFSIWTIGLWIVSHYEGHRVI